MCAIFSFIICRVAVDSPLHIFYFYLISCCYRCRYFSYEHFYVIYCKFWELDTDHDFLIDKENLIRYGNHALTYRIVDRIFSQVCFHVMMFLTFRLFQHVLLNEDVLVVGNFSDYHFFVPRFPEGSPVRLKERWDMKILFILYCQRRINHLSLVLSIGTPLWLLNIVVNLLLLWQCIYFESIHLENWGLTLVFVGEMLGFSFGILLCHGKKTVPNYILEGYFLWGLKTIFSFMKLFCFEVVLMCYWGII